MSDEQLSLIDEPTPQATEPAGNRLIARVVVDSPLPHLDREFDYLVHPDDDADAQPGCRVKVRFAGKRIDAFITARVTESDHLGRLAHLDTLVSAERVLTPEVLELARQVARRWAGTTADVLRLAIPPRHARAEAHPRQQAVAAPEIGEPDAWLVYPRGDDYVRALAEGKSPRIVFSALPHHRHERAVAQAVAATLASGRGSIVCVPDIRDLPSWDAALTEVLGPNQHAVLTAAAKPAERYRSFLSVSRGEVRVVLGTRAAAYAPVANLGLLAIWDDGDDLHAEPRAPYPHAREVLLLRAAAANAGVLIAGYARTAEAQSLVASRWCSDITADQPTRRREWARVDVTDGTEHGDAPVRLPHAVFAAIRAAEGPVLVQVPRRGYRSALACNQCRTPARCPQCTGPLEQRAANQSLVCTWCGRTEDHWHCAECHATRLRSPVVGALRTAEEFASAFTGRRILTSGGRGVLDDVDGDDVIVLATPGAEPRAAGGYALVVLLDTSLMMARDDFRVVEESHRRWFNAIALARYGGAALAVGESTALQALVRADPVGLAARELADRTDTHLPPSGRLATVEGSASDLSHLLHETWTEHTEVLGPAPIDENTERLVLRAPRSEGLALADKLKLLAAHRSAEKLPMLRTRIDPQVF